VYPLWLYAGYHQVIEARLRFTQGRVVVAVGTTRDEVLAKIRQILEDNAGFTCLSISIEAKMKNYRRVGSA